MGRDSYDDLSSKFAPLIGGNFCLILILVCDWLKLKRNLGRRIILGVGESEAYQAPVYFFFFILLISTIYTYF